MTPEEVAARLKEILAKEGLDDPTWISSLDEYDEPPLYSRDADVEFLRDIDIGVRGPVVLRWAIDVLDAHAGAIETLPNASSYFVSMTFQDWDRVHEGELLVPTPSLFVSPDVEKELPRFRLKSPVGREAKEVSRWLGVLGREDLCVREAVSREDSETFRVHVGHSVPRAFHTLRDFSISLAG